MLVLLDLPGDLVREMREKAAQKGRKLSNTAEECIRRSLALEEAVPSESAEGEALTLFDSAIGAVGGEMSLGECLWRAKIR
jgi:hypothetical protein